MKKCFIYFLLASGLFIKGCDNQESAITGEWQKVNQEKSNEEELISIQAESDNPSPVQTILIFNADNEVDVKQGDNEYSAKYIFQPGELTLGNREYEVLKLNSDSLVLRAISDFSFGENIDRYYRIK